MDDYFLSHRSLLMALAYRMLGSVSDAEDMVQDTYIAWQKHQSSGISNPKAWLVKVCTNLTLDYLGKAYKQRELYVGTWLPEPILNSFVSWDEREATDNPEQRLSLKESLTTTMMILLESLSPMERAVFLLKEVFNYDYKEISQIIDKKEPACRKLFQRSKESLKDRNPRYESNDPEAKQVILNFFESAKQGDVEALKSQLSVDSQFWSDGGGKVQAAREVLSQSNKIAGFFAKVFGEMTQSTQAFKMEFSHVNNLPGLVVSVQDENLLWKMETVFSFEIFEGKLSRIYAIRNPEKLKLSKKYLQFH